MMATEMQRWALTSIGKDHLERQRLEIPVPAPFEVLVKVRAVALNHRDKMVIESGRGLPLQFPFTPCSDMAGEVIALGDGVTRFGVGDQIITTFAPGWIDGRRPGNARTPSYETLGGFYPGVLAEYVALPEGWLVSSPTLLEPSHACTLPCAGVTAWCALIEHAGLQAGDSVLIPSTGGVGLFGVQVAKASGAEVIVCGRPENEDRVMALGANHYVRCTRDEDWTEAVLHITQGQGVDHVLDVVGGVNLGRAVKVAAVGGHICQIGALGGFDATIPAMPMMLKNLSLHGVGTGSRCSLERLVRAVDGTGLAPVIGAQYDFMDFPAALAHLERGAFGKIILNVS